MSQTTPNQQGTENPPKPPPKPPKPLQEVDMVSPLEPIEFLVPDLFPMGYVSFVTAREGVGKTTLLTGLLWQTSRPHGGEWLGFDVQYGSSIFVNTDAPDGRSRSVRFWLDRHANAYPDGNLGQITVLEGSGGLHPDHLIQIAKIAKEKGVKCVVIDSYMGSFPGADPSALEKQMGKLQLLVQLAAMTGAAVLVTDHHSKSASINGEFTAMGSVSKSAQSRAGLSLTRVPNADTGGQEIIRLEVVKQSFAARLEPFGALIEVDNVKNSVELKLCDLPDTKVNTKEHRAKLTILAFLTTRLGLWQTKKTLFEEACKGGGVSTRTAEKALKAVIDEMGQRLESRMGEGKSPQKEYKLLPAETRPSSEEADKAEPLQPVEPNDPTLLQDCKGYELPMQDSPQPLQLGFAKVTPAAKVAGVKPLESTEPQITQPETKPLETIAKWGDD